MKKFLQYLEIIILLTLIFWVSFAIIDEIKAIKSAKEYQEQLLEQYRIERELEKEEFLKKQQEQDGIGFGIIVQ